MQSHTVCNQSGFDATSSWSLLTYFMVLSACWCSFHFDTSMNLISQFTLALLPCWLSFFLHEKAVLVQSLLQAFLVLCLLESVLIHRTLYFCTRPGFAVTQGKLHKCHALIHFGYTTSWRWLILANVALQSHFIASLRDTLPVRMISTEPVGQDVKRLSHQQPTSRLALASGKAHSVELQNKETSICF